MAALDVCRSWMEGPGGADYRRTAEHVRRLRTALPALNEGISPLDPTRLTVHTPDGFAAQRTLEGQGIFVEMAGRGHLVCILTCMDTPEDLSRLEQALRALPPGGEAVPLRPYPRRSSPHGRPFSARGRSCLWSRPLGGCAPSRWPPTRRGYR